MRLRPRAEVISTKENRVLAGYNQEKGYVIFPGGGIDPNESAIEAAKREAFEEADRVLINCTVAHPPTVQVWPEDYAASNEGKWGKGFHGGLTYWMTGSTSKDPFHADPAERHEDYEEIFEWKPIREVIARLKQDLHGDWAEDVKVRLKVLETHLDMQKRHKEAQLRKLATFLPRLSLNPGQSRLRR